MEKAGLRKLQLKIRYCWRRGEDLARRLPEGMVQEELEMELKPLPGAGPCQGMESPDHGSHGYKPRPLHTLLADAGGVKRPFTEKSGQTQTRPYPTLEKPQKNLHSTSNRNDQNCRPRPPFLFSLPGLVTHRCGFHVGAGPLLRGQDCGPDGGGAREQHGKECEPGSA